MFISAPTKSLEWVIQHLPPIGNHTRMLISPPSMICFVCKSTAEERNQKSSNNNFNSLVLSDMLRQIEMEHAYLGYISVYPGSDCPRHLTHPRTWTNTVGREGKVGRVVQVDECACELFLNQSNWCVYHFSICLVVSDYSLIIAILASLYTTTSPIFQRLMVVCNLTLPTVL